MSTRRGAAMLLVLMTCTVMIVGVTIIARAKTSAAITSLQAHRLVRCDQLIRASQQPILHWLDEVSSSATLDPDLGAPVVIVHDTETIDPDGRVRIQLTAWDQQGMWPANSESLGLTPLVQPDQDLQMGYHLGSLEVDSVVYPSQSSPDTIGGLVATHSPWPTRSGRTRTRGTASINVNTAPQALLDQISARYDVGDLGMLIESRQQSEFVAMSQTVSNAEGEEIQLVSVSRVWAFRAQVAVGNVSRSVWSVYANQGGQWQLVQRTVIGEPSE